MQFCKFSEATGIKVVCIFLPQEVKAKGGLPGWAWWLGGLGIALGAVGCSLGLVVAILVIICGPLILLLVTIF